MTADRKLIACDPADLAAVLRWVSKIPLDHDDEVVPNIIDRLRADLARAFTVEDVRADTTHPDHTCSALDALARRLSPPAEHKVTLHGSRLECSCAWRYICETYDPFEPARLAREHLAEHGEDR